jgi:cob(I)alamin adenosyltransferase
MKEALAEVRGMLRGELTADSTPGGSGESAAYRAARAVLRVAESAERERE